MRKKNWMRYGAAPILMLGLAAPAMMTGCDANEVCGADLGARLTALNAAVDALVAVSQQMRFDVTVACTNIANDLGDDTVTVPTNPEEVTDVDLNTACNAANTALNGALEAGVEITIGIEGGRCEIDIDAAFDCEANCTVDASCEPGKIEARCDPGELSVQCEAECTAEGTCQGTATVEANCTGTCEGVCKGTCGGNDTGTEGTVCDSTCEGKCTGDCKLDAQVDVDCGVDVYCKGGCDSTFTAPRCEGEIELPSCDIDADCQAGCEGEAKFEATCTEPTIVVQFDAGANAELEQTLTDNFGKIVSVALDQGPLVIEAAGDVAKKIGAASEAVGSTVACSILATANLASNVSLSVEASVSVTATASASGSVNSCAGEASCDDIQM